MILTIHDSKDTTMETYKSKILQLFHGFDKEKLSKAGEKVTQIFSWIQDKAVFFYTILILCVLPLYTRQGYFALTLAKFQFMEYATLLFGGIFLVCNLTCKVINRKKIFFAKWNAVDCLALLFLLAGGISVRFSEYGMDAFTGECGRRNGLLIYLIYALAIFLIVENGKLYRWSLYAMEFAAIFICGIGILNHFGADPLHFFWDLVEEQQTYFSSTIGHIDVFGVYAGMMFAYAATGFLLAKKRQEKTLHIITSVVAMCAVLTNSADGAFLGVIVFFLFGWILIQNVRMFLEYNGLLVAFFAMSLMMRVLQKQIGEAKPVDGISQIMLEGKIAGIGLAVTLGAALLVVLGAILYGMGTRQRQSPKREDRKQKRTQLKRVLRIGKRILEVLLVLVLLLIAMMFVVVNSNKGAIQASSLLEKLHITREWGNYRGYIWLKTVDYYNGLPLFQKLFGTGPDTTYQIYQQICTESFLTDYGSYFDNAHNEYLQLLLTHGIIGLGAYVGWIFLSIRECMQKGKENAKFTAIAFAIFAYMAMALVGIQMITCMGIVVVLLGFGRCESTLETGGSNSWQIRLEKKRKKSRITS